MALQAEHARSIAFGAAKPAQFNPCSDDELCAKDAFKEARACDGRNNLECRYEASEGDKATREADAPREWRNLPEACQDKAIRVAARLHRTRLAQPRRSNRRADVLCSGLQCIRSAFHTRAHAPTQSRNRIVACLALQQQVAERASPTSKKKAGRMTWRNTVPTPSRATRCALLFKHCTATKCASCFRPQRATRLRSRDSH
eukprot:50054-Pleurochrysis_carterae.AAC.1